MYRLRIKHGGNFHYFVKRNKKGFVFDDIPYKSKLYKTKKAALKQGKVIAEALDKIVELAPTTNPVPNSKVAEAAQLYEQFTGHPHEKTDIYLHNGVDTFAEIGKVTGIKYRTKRDGNTEYYEHLFNSKSQPTLAAAHDGSYISLFGGDYEFTKNGITDRG